MLNAEEVFQAIQKLPVRERLRVVERVVHELADASTSEAAPRPARSLLGLFADEPELVDEVSAMAFAARKRDKLRTRSEDDESDP